MAEKDDATGGDKSQDGQDKSKDTAADGQDAGKTFTQAELDSIIQKRLGKAEKDWEKKVADAEAKAKLSEDERTKAELADAKAQLAERDRRDSVKEAGEKAGVNNPTLLYKAIKDDLEVDEKTGKITNLTELLESAKTDLPQLFTTATQKQAGSADGGSGKESKTTLTKEEVEKMSQADINANWEAVSQFLSTQKK